MTTAAHPLGPLAPLANTDQWVVVQMPEKIPLNFITGHPCNAHERANQTTYEAALAIAQFRGLQATPGGPGHTVGFVLTEQDDWFVVDVDKARDAVAGWSAVAQEIVQALPGCVAELSQSGQGLHVWGRFPDPPKHGKRRTDISVEFYTEKRFVAIGTGQIGTLADRCDALPTFITQWFEPRQSAGADIPDDGPCPEWDGHADDAALIEAARRASDRSAGVVFGDGVTFSNLFDCNEQALAKRWPSSSGDTFDRSSADYSLAYRLAYWTGRDVARIARIMWMSKLARDKWETHPSYLVGHTIHGACKETTKVHKRRRAEPPAPPTSTSTSTSTDDPPGAIMAGVPYSAAQSILKRRYRHPEARTLNAWQGQFYEWLVGGWLERTPDDMRAELYALLQREALGTCHPTRERVSGILDALKAAAHVDSSARPPCWVGGPPGPPPHEILPCRNGLLHLPTRQLLPSTPRFFSTVATSCEYLPDAPAPSHWLSFLHQLWPEDQEAIDALQEVFGYLLTPDTSQQKLFLIVGPKRSGKGTVGRVLSRLLGEANVASPSLGSLGGDFGLQPLFGKLAAIVSDARLGGRADAKAIAENLLRISGEDPVTVNRKFLAPITMQLPVRFVMLTNELPRLADASGAMASRFVVLRMDRSFYGNEDPGLTARLLAELPGVLNWAVEGWQRLNRRGHFITPRSAQDEVQELADLGSPITAFVRDACILSPTAAVSVDTLFQTWRLWCRDAGRQHEGDKVGFGRDLRAAVGGLRRAQLREGGNRVPTYQGIGLLSEWQARAVPFTPRAGMGGTGGTGR